MYDLSRTCDVVEVGYQETLSLVARRQAVRTVMEDLNRLNGLVLPPCSNEMMTDTLHSNAGQLIFLPQSAGPDLMRAILEIFAVCVKRELEGQSAPGRRLWNS